MTSVAGSNLQVRNVNPSETGECCDSVHTYIFHNTLTITNNKEVFLQEFLENLEEMFLQHAEC